ncbi:hypothetical protein HZC31_06405 [Candidatus Woesearchaeota archaeon]|nr:hypothetical protein [Candidatus Woesearchaeota archaeon]
MMEHSSGGAPYDLLLQTLSRRLLKPTISQKEGLDALASYITGTGWITEKPLWATLLYWRTRQEERSALNSCLEELYSKKRELKNDSLSLDAVVAVAYTQTNEVDRQALLVLGHEFGFYTITKESNSAYFVDDDSKQSIVALVTNLEAAKKGGITTDAVMAYLLPQRTVSNAREETLDIGDTCGYDSDITGTFEFDDDQELDNFATEELDPLSPTVLIPLYTMGITAVLANDRETITQIGKNNMIQLRDAQYKKHIACALRAAYSFQNNVIPQAIRYYEESIALTPEPETHEPLYAASITALSGLYCRSVAYTERFATLYPLAKAVAIPLDEQTICEKVRHFAEMTTKAYSTQKSDTSLRQLDKLLPLTELPSVFEIVTTAYTSMMRHALDDKNIDHARHCHDKIAALSQKVPFEDELRDGIEEKVLDAIVLFYEFAALQYDVGAVEEAAKALDNCERVLKTGGAGALHLLTAKIRLAEGNNDAALASLEAAVASDFSDPRYKVTKEEVYVLLARQYYLRKNYNKLRDLFEDGFEKLPSHQNLIEYKLDVVNDWFELGHKAERNKDYSDARMYYRRIIEFEPINARAHLRIALTYETQGRKIDAQTYYQRTLVLEAQSLEAQQGLLRSIKEVITPQ